MKKLTRSQKTYLAVLAVALLALVFDQVLFSPDSAGAVEPIEPPTAPPVIGTPEAISDLLDAVRQPRVTLASRFDDLAREEAIDLDVVGDALRAPAAWFPDGQQVHSQRNDDPPIDKAAEKLRGTYTLKSVMANARGGFAIVSSEKEGSQRLQVGQELAGFRLIEVRPRAIVLEQGGTTVELALAEGK